MADTYENEGGFLTIQRFWYSPFNNLRDQFERIVPKCIVIAKEKFLAKFGRGGAVRPINHGKIIYRVVKHHMIVWRTGHRNINLGENHMLAGDIMQRERDNASRGHLQQIQMRAFPRRRSFLHFLTTPPVLVLLPAAHAPSDVSTSLSLWGCLSQLYRLQTDGRGSIPHSLLCCQTYRSCHVHGRSLLPVPPTN